jgi:hypothetical protein
MKNRSLLLGIPFYVLVLFSSHAIGAVDTRLVLIGNTISDGQGTLVIDVQISSKDVSPQFLGYFGDAFYLDATLHNQLIGTPEVSNQGFSDHYTASLGYNAGQRKIYYSFDWTTSSADAHIGGSFETAVRVIIHYTQIGATTTISWTDPSNFVVKDELDAVITGDRGNIPSSLQDISLPVELTNLAAAYAPEEKVILKWQTESEVDCAGFNVWRCETGDTIYSKISRNLIPGSGSSSDRHYYTYSDREVENDKEYSYRIEEIDIYANSTFYGPVTILIGENKVQLSTPISLSLMQNFPNPFNPITEIKYEVPIESQVSLVIYNVLGEVVNTLVDEYQQANIYSVKWDGRDMNGRIVNSGIYFYKLEAGLQVIKRKMTLLK